MNAISISNVAIRQNSNLFNLNDLHKASGGESKNQPSNWFRLEQTQDLIKELENSSNPMSLIIKKTEGRNGGTYACKELVYAYATWISAKFFLQVIRTFDAVVTGRLNQTKALPSGLTAEQQDEVKKMHNLLVQSVPFEKQKGLAITLWSAVKAKFKTGYKDVPPEQFPEILSLMARVAVEKGAQYREQAALELETVPKIYRNQANIPFDLGRDGNYLVQVKNGCIFRSSMRLAEMPYDDSLVPVLKKSRES